MIMTFLSRMLVLICIAVVLSATVNEAARAQEKARLVELRPILDQPALNGPTDLVRFTDQWFCVTRDGGGALFSKEIRVLASPDGVKWTTAGVLAAPPPRSVGFPRLSVNAAGQLVVWAYSSSKETSIQYFGWHSKDGKTWTEAEPVGPENHWVERPVWHKGAAYNFVHGCICGNAQTVLIMSSRDGKDFRPLYEETFRGFFPSSGALVFDGDTAVCLFSRSGPKGVGSTGYLAASGAPYTQWQWTETDRRITNPRMIRLANGKLIAAVGVFDKGQRTVLCEVDPARAKLTELLELPTDGAHVFAGLAEHDGHLWVNFHGKHDGKTGLFFAKVQQAGPDVRRKELDKLRGEWRIREATIDGTKLPAPALKRGYVRFGDGNLTYYMPPTEPAQVDFGPRTSLFEIDPEKKPKTLDVFEKENPKERGLAIYELKGDELRMVMADPIGAPRPDRFAGKSPEPDEKKRPTWTLLVLERRK